MPKNVKNTTLPGLFELLAPHSCRGCGRIGAPLCDRCKNYIIAEHSTYRPDLPADFLDSLASSSSSASDTPSLAASSNPSPSSSSSAPSQPPIFILGPRTGLIGTMVRDLKYHSVRALARSLAELLDATLPDFKGQVSIVPLPTNTRHIRARGLDHTLLIAKHLAKLRNYKVEKLLQRIKNTTQVGASEAQRKTQALAAYQAKPNAKLSPQTTYLLLDDVWTTGASMKAALQHFRSLNPAKFHLVLLARN